MNSFKRGQIGFPQVVLGLFGIFVAIVVIMAFVNNNGNFSDSLKNSMESVTSSFSSFTQPLFGILLGFGQNDSDNFLKVLAFILVSIIIIGVLNSANVFGNNDYSNFVIGLIISIIGVRFMPGDIWSSLTAPSSALVATILVGIPFLALVFITLKVNSNLARKLLWTFYLIFMFYLIVKLSNPTYIEVYYIFMVLAGIIMVFDSSVRRYVFKEKAKLEVESELRKMSVRERSNLRKQIAEWQEIIADTSTPDPDRKVAKDELARARALYGDLSTI